MTHADNVWCDNLCDFRLIDVRENERSPIERYECLICGDRHTYLFGEHMDKCVREFPVCRECYRTYGRTCRLYDKFVILKGRGYKVTAKMFERKPEHPKAKIGEILWQ